MTATNVEQSPAAALQTGSVEELAKALSVAQGEIEAASKGKENPHFKSRYADLASIWDACRAPLAKNGLAVVQQPISSGDLVGVATTLLHSSGQWMRSELWVKPQQPGPQALGSCLTYLRRYSLAAVVGVAPDDDDGNAAEGRAEGKAPAPRVASATSAAGTSQPTTETAPVTGKTTTTGAASIKHDGNYITDGQLKVLHITRREVGGQYCTDGGKDEDDARSLWRSKVLSVYRDKDGSRITSSKQLSKAQANHLIDRLTRYAERTRATLAARDAETNVTDIIPINREPGADDVVDEEMATPDDLDALGRAAADRWGDSYKEVLPEWLQGAFNYSTVMELRKQEAIDAARMIRNGK